MRKHKRGAYALIYLMGVSTILLILVGALLSACHQQVFLSRFALMQSQALYVAEAGLNDAIAHLERNNSWAPANYSGTVGNQGSYVIRFHSPPGTTTAQESINNLTAPGAANSYLGGNTVPPHSAFLVVTGTWGSATRTVEAFIVGGGDLLQNAALGATGQINLAGALWIDGYDSLTNLLPAPAGLHSNYSGAGPAITWNKVLSTDQARIGGQITTVSNNAGAISLAGSHNVDYFHSGQQTGVRPKRFPPIDVAGLVSAQSSHPGPPLPSVGAVDLTASENYYSGNQVINGDLVLKNGAKIYVNGSLTVNGSITGDGAVVVTGRTTLYGDASLTGDSTKYVSIVSRDHVTLKGFDGSKYLDTFAATEPASTSTPRGDEAAELWSDIKDSVQWMKTNLNASTHWTAPGFDSDVDRRASVLAPGPNNWGSPSVGTPFQTLLPTGPRRNSVDLLQQKIPATGMTANFVRKRLQSMQDMFMSARNSRTTYTNANLDPNALITKWRGGTWDPNVDTGVFDTMQSLKSGMVGPWTPPNPADVDAILFERLRVIDQLDYSRLGAAHFHGMVYTNGGILAENEINLMGTLIAAGDNSLATAVIDGHTVKPGDVNLQTACRFTYVKDMFDQGIATFSSLGILGVRTYSVR